MKFRGFDETGRWYLKIIALLALLLAILKMTGCSNPNDVVPGVSLREVSRDGHSYLIFRDSNVGGIAVVHSESCPCHRKAERE